MRRSLWNIFIDWVAERIEIEIDPALAVPAESSPLNGNHIIYLSRRPSAMHTALLRRVLLRAGLPVPKSTLKIPADGHFRRSRYPRITTRSFLRPRRGTEAVWIDAKKHRRRLQQYLDDLLHFDRRHKTVLIPFAIFTGRGARLIHKDSIAWFDFDYFPTLDLIRIVLFAMFRDQVQIRIGAPIVPRRDEPVAGTLRKVSRQIYGWEKLVQAARTPSRESLSRVVLSGPRYDRVARDLSLTEGSSLFQIQARAEKILDGMATRFHSWGIGFLYLILRRILPGMFSIQIVGIDSLKRQIGTSPVVVIPSHRSHCDYIILSYLFFTGGLPLPHVAAGDNLNFWPVGRLLRAGGAFFIRRKIDRDDRLYKTVLDLYLTMLMKQGKVIEFFIEGGRSRSGTMLAPRFGLLKYLVRAYLLGYREDLAFVPVSITYDRVMEERALLGEQAGAKKERESVFQLLKLLPRVRRSFGGVTVVVGEPISMRTFFDYRAVDNRKGETSAAGVAVEAEVPSTNELTALLGITLTGQIQAGTVLSPRSLLSIVLADLDRRGNGRRELDGPKVSSRIAELFQLLGILSGGAGVSPALTDSTGVIPPLSQADSIAAKLPLRLSASLAQIFKLSGWSECIDGLAAQLAVDENDICKFESEAKRFLPVEGSALRRDFYRNTVINHLISPLFYLLLGQPGVTALFAGDEDLISFQRQAAEKLHRLFSPIVLLPDFSTWIARFISDGDLLERSGFLTRCPRPAGEVGGWRIEPEAWSRFGYLVWSIRAILEALQSALAVSAALAEDGIDEEQFNRRVRNGTIQLVTTSMLAWVREFLIGEGVLQKIVMDRDSSGPRVLGVVPNDQKQGQVIFQLVRTILGGSSETAP